MKESEISFSSLSISRFTLLGITFSDGQTHKRINSRLILANKFGDKNQKQLVENCLFQDSGD